MDPVQIWLLSPPRVPLILRSLICQARQLLKSSDLLTRYCSPLLNVVVFGVFENVVLQDARPDTPTRHSRRLRGERTDVDAVAADEPAQDGTEDVNLVNRLA